MKTTETKLLFPELDTLAEYVRLLAVNLDIGYKGEKGDKGDKGDPGKDADIEGTNQAIARANKTIKDLEDLELRLNTDVYSFIDNKKEDIDRYLSEETYRQDLQIQNSIQNSNAAIERANQATTSANDAATNANLAALNAVLETAKIAPKLEDLLTTLTKALTAVNAVNGVAKDLNSEIEKVLNINITNDGDIVTITDRLGLSSNINVKGDKGISAYEVAVNNGFTGTEEEWLDSLKAKLIYYTEDLINKFALIQYLNESSLSKVSVAENHIYATILSKKVFSGIDIGVSSLSIVHDKGISLDTRGKITYNGEEIATKLLIEDLSERLAALEEALNF